MDMKSPPISVDSSDGSDSEDSNDESDLCTPSNSNYQKSAAEVELLESFKKRKYRPVLDRETSSVLCGEDEHGKEYELMVGPVLSRGKNLPSGKNLADYINKRAG